MIKKTEIEKQIKSLKTKKNVLLIGVAILCFVFMGLSYIVFDSDTATKKEDIRAKTVSFDVSLDTITNPVSSVFSRKLDTMNNNPFKKKKKDSVLNKKIEKLEKLGTSKPMNPYKNKDLWQGLENINSPIQKPKKKLSERELKLKRIEEKRKQREQRRRNNKITANVDVKEKVKIKAYVYRLQKVLPYYEVNLTLITPFVYQGKKYEAGFPISGTVQKVEKNKVFITVESIGEQEINLKAYDPARNHEGLYMIQAAILEKEIQRELEKNAIKEVAQESKSNIADAIANIINSDKKKKLTRIPLKNDYEMVLKNY